MVANSDSEATIYVGLAKEEVELRRGWCHGDATAGSVVGECAVNRTHRPDRVDAHVIAKAPAFQGGREDGSAPTREVLHHAGSSAAVCAGPARSVEVETG